jgi:hypothetical protein
MDEGLKIEQTPTPEKETPLEVVRRVEIEYEQENQKLRDLGDKLVDGNLNDVAFDELFPKWEEQWEITDNALKRYAAAMEDYRKSLVGEAKAEL